MNHATNKANDTVDISFEPNEITACSSYHSTSGMQSPLNESTNDANFSVSASKIMTSFDKNEFPSNSQTIEKFSADKANWQNCTYSVSDASIEKHKLDFTSFSGVFGEMDLSIESCPGKKIPVDQYFKRKCNDIGVPGSMEGVITNLDCIVKTPVKENDLKPLVDSIIIKDASVSLVKMKEKCAQMSNTIHDANSILSLNTIIGTLKDIDSNTPHRLVDQLLIAQKKKKYLEVEGYEERHKRRKTYFLSPKEKSIPTINSNKHKEDIDLANLIKKLSIDGGTENENRNRKQQIARMLLFASNKNLQETESFTDVCKEEISRKETSGKNAGSSFAQDAVQISVPEIKLLLQNSVSVLSFNDKLGASCMSSKIDIRCDNEEESYSNINAQDIQRKEIIKDISDSTMSLLSAENTNTGMKTDINNIIIGKNTEQLCNCIIGMTCEANVELINEGDKWITYFLKLHEIRGDKRNITLNIVQDAILIKPYGIQSTKIKVKITKMCDPIIAVLNIIISDMMTKSKSCMKHMICFKPEELELDIICDSDKQELDFQYITENSTKVLPIIFYNKNSVDVLIKLAILHNDAKTYSIDGTFNEPAKLNESHDELTHLVVKSHDKFTAHIKCERSQSTSTDGSQRQLQCWKSKLVIHVQCHDGTILFTKEILLYARAGICEIQIVDTDMPIVVSKQQGKLLNIINSGNVMTNVSAIIVPVEEYPTATQRFSIKPDNILLQPGERNSFLITHESQILDTEIKDGERHAEIKLIAGNNVYHFWLIEENIEYNLLTSKDKNYLCCNMSCNVVSTGSPISLQNTSSNRCSPSSMISSTVEMENSIPIRATHTALIWNSVKTGQSEVKEFTIRNMSNNKIKIQIDILDDDKNFKFLGNQQAVSTSMILAMQYRECKTLTVVFSPYHTGPAIGKITIKHYMSTRGSNEFQRYKKIFLYGYGGYGTVKILNICKDTNGNMWLPLSTLSSETITLGAEIKLKNTGDLSSFAKIKIIPKVISPINTSWHLNFKELILSPNETRRLLVEYHPKKEDFTVLQCLGVSHVATINIIYGDEPIRWRMRKLYDKIKESDGLTGNETFKNVMQPICKIFPGEQLITGLSLIHDSVKNLSDLCTGIYQSEIMLTVEVCEDDTLSILHNTDDKSEIYYSLMSDDSCVNETDGASFFIS